jgi:hypothetical protein
MVHTEQSDATSKFRKFLDQLSDYIRLSSFQEKLHNMLHVSYNLKFSYLIHKYIPPTAPAIKYLAHLLHILEVPG